MDRGVVGVPSKPLHSDVIPPFPPHPIIRVIPTNLGHYLQLLPGLLPFILTPSDLEILIFHQIPVIKHITWGLYLLVTPEIQTTPFHPDPRVDPDFLVGKFREALQFEIFPQIRLFPPLLARLFYLIRREILPFFRVQRVLGVDQGQLELLLFGGP